MANLNLFSFVFEPPFFPSWLKVRKWFPCLFSLLLILWELSADTQRIRAKVFPRKRSCDSWRTRSSVNHHFLLFPKSWRGRRGEGWASINNDYRWEKRGTWKTKSWRCPQKEERERGMYAGEGGQKKTKYERRKRWVLKRYEIRIEMIPNLSEMIDLWLLLESILTVYSFDSMKSSFSGLYTGESSATIWSWLENIKHYK